MIKRLLKKHRYPPEGMDDAVQTVMTQCELWTDNNDMELSQKSELDVRNHTILKRMVWRMGYIFGFLGRHVLLTVICQENCIMNAMLVLLIR